MRQRRKPTPMELDEEAGSHLDDRRAAIHQVMLLLRESEGDAFAQQGVEIRGSVGWIQLPPVIHEKDVELIILAWFAQGRWAPEA